MIEIIGQYDKLNMQIAVNNFKDERVEIYILIGKDLRIEYQ
jgi:hypothetical protein